MTLRATDRRRIYYSAVAAITFAGIAWLQADYGTGLRRTQFFDGWILLAGILFLTLFNLRKKLPMLPLGRASNWTRIHVFTGFFTVLNSPQLCAGTKLLLRAYRIVACITLVT